VGFNIIDNDCPRCIAWMAAQTDKPCSDMVSMIGLERNGELIAVAGYNCFNGKSCQMHMTIKRGAYVTRNFVWFVCYYPFVQIGLELIIGILPEDNADIIKLAKHAGFEEKYRVDGGHPDGDLLLCTMKKQDCRFLNIKFKG